MSKEEIAQAVRDAMRQGDLSFKETAHKLARSITTVQNILACRPVSKRTRIRVELVFIENVKT